MPNPITSDATRFCFSTSGDTMKLLSNIVRFLTLIFFIEFINSNQFISVFLQKSYGSCNKKYCNISIVTRPLNRTSKWYSLDIYFRPGLKLDKPFNVEIIAYKKFRTEYRPHMVRVKHEVCDVLDKVDHPFFNLMRKLRFQGNYFDPCPITGHRYIKPYVPTHDFVPLVPVGEWKMEYNFSKIMNNSDERIFSYSEFYEIKPTSAVEF